MKDKTISRAHNFVVDAMPILNLPNMYYSSDKEKVNAKIL